MREAAHQVRGLQQSCEALGVPVALEILRTRQLKLESYDRLFPNQDAMPKGGLGNLMALPLRKIPWEQGFSIFVDADLRPYSDQWAFLASRRVT